MKRIPQYLRPHGAKRYLSVDVSDVTYQLLKDLNEHHIYIQAEVLTTGQVAITASDNVNETDVAIEVVSNTPAVKQALARVIERAHERLCTTWQDWE